ncbi:hypothetical protein CISIN_1g0421212mg, partial [Citrus sinensis]
MDDYVFPIM